MTWIFRSNCRMRRVSEHGPKTARSAVPRMPLQHGPGNDCAWLVLRLHVLDLQRNTPQEGITESYLTDNRGRNRRRHVFVAQKKASRLVACQAVVSGVWFDVPTAGTAARRAPASKWGVKAVSDKGPPARLGREGLEVAAKPLRSFTDCSSEPQHKRRRGQSSLGSVADTLPALSETRP